MISIQSTPNHAGVSIRGDMHDLEQLYSALHSLIGAEGEYLSLAGARLRVLNLCYQIRHAFMGNREVELLDNGMHDELKKHFATLAPERNVYYAFRMFWPEMLFLLLALNEFASIRERKSKLGKWDADLCAVRMFQATVAECLRGVMTETGYARTIKLLNGSFVWIADYCTQYIDVMNIKFLRMDAEKRLKNLSVMAKRFAERNDDYYEMKEAVQEAAAEFGVPQDAIELEGWTYPEEVDW